MRRWIDVPYGRYMTNTTRTTAGRLQVGNKVTINNQVMTVKSVWFRQARADKRAMSMMTSGRDLLRVVSVDFLNAQGRLVSHEFNELEPITIQEGK